MTKDIKLFNSCDYTWKKFMKSSRDRPYLKDFAKEYNRPKVTI